MENLVYYKHQNIRGKSTPTKMSGMVNGQMWLEVSCTKLKKKKSSELVMHLYFQSFLGRWGQGGEPGIRF